MHEHFRQPVPLRHLQQRVQMRQQRMHAPVAAQAHDVQPVAARPAHRFQQYFVLEEFPRRDHCVDPRHVHLNHPPGADVQMPHFAVAHLAFGQAHGRPRRPHQRIGKLAQQRVVVRLVRERNGVSFDGRGVAPAIENRENQRLFRGHVSCSRPTGGTPSCRGTSPPRPIPLRCAEAGCTWRCGPSGWPTRS